MSANNTLPIQLTSTAVTPSSEGYYEFDQMCFLFPHEPIRRELNRGKLAFEQANITLYPWKGRYLRKWLGDFLIPIIFDHHDAEENYLFPSYLKLGVKIPDTIETGHQDLVVFLKKMEQISEELAAQVERNNVEATEKSFEALKEVYFQFYNTVLAHLEEEEKFWPPVIREKGEEAYQEINAYMHKETKNQKSAKLFIMSVLDSMGYEFDATNPTHDPRYDTRWCGERLLDEKIINKIPYFVRAWIFPSMNRQYQYYKQIIQAVAMSEVDELPPQFVDSSTCILI